MTMKVKAVLFILNFLLTFYFADALIIPTVETFAKIGTLHTLQELTYWAGKEEEIYNVLGEWEVLIDKEIQWMERYLEDYEESSGKALRNLKVPAESADERGRIIGSSQVLGHLMTDRFVSTVDPLRNLLESPKYAEAEENVNKILELDALSELLGRSQWPDRNDLVMSHSSLFSIQQLHELKPNEITSNLKPETNHDITLNSFDSALLGQFALKQGLYTLAIEWLSFAINKLKNNFNDNSISMELVEDMFTIAVQSHNRKRAIIFSKTEPDQSIFNVYTEPYYPQVETKTMKQFYWEYDGDKYGNGSHFDLNVVSLCKGRDFQPIEIKSRLKCYLERKIHPYFYLNPVKAEILSEHPPITQFYEVLGVATRKEIYNSRERKFVSTVIDGSHYGLDLKTRTSSGRMLSKELTDKISKMTEMFTGLKVSDEVEGIQTVEYVYGRLYHPHSDPVEYGEQNVGADNTVQLAGDRIATVLYYVDVSPNLVGALTPFCEVGIAARPVPGSAVFWLNMFKNGTFRTDVNHAACPPLHGNKIALNQWIRYNVNFQTFLCSLNKYE